MEIYNLEWTDPTISATVRVCPNCHGEMLLADEDSREWHCDQCWNAFDDNGNRLWAITFGGIAMKCPECGDRRIARDPWTDQRYCKGCLSTFRDLETEAVRNQDGQITGGRVKDYGQPDRAQACPNCGDMLRVQFYEPIGGDIVEGYTCSRCDLTYWRGENGHLVPHPECPRCGGRSLVRFGDVRRCKFCGIKTDLEGQYINPNDAPKDEGEKSEVHSTYHNVYQA